MKLDGDAVIDIALSATYVALCALAVAFFTAIVYGFWRVVLA